MFSSRVILPISPKSTIGEQKSTIVAGLYPRFSPLHIGPFNTWTDFQQISHSPLKTYAHTFTHKVESFDKIHVCMSLNCNQVCLELPFMFFLISKGSLRPLGGWMCRQMNLISQLVLPCQYPGVSSNHLPLHIARHDLNFASCPCSA